MRDNETRRVGGGVDAPPGEARARREHDSESNFLAAYIALIQSLSPTAAHWQSENPTNTPPHLS